MNVNAGARLAAIALTALAVGLLVYLAERPGPSVYFLPDSWNALVASSPLGQHLPSLLHTFAFAILMALALGASQSAALGSCLFWAAVNTLFELGQSDAIATSIATFAPAWFGCSPLLDNAGSYFVHGTFDPVDIGFVGLGAVAAYIVITRVYRGGDSAC